jgi:hypothetical protein
MLKLIGIISLLLGLAGGAYVGIGGIGGGGWNSGGTVHQAPEIDPAGAMAGLTLLAGGLAVLRGRRSGKK